LFPGCIRLHMEKKEESSSLKHLFQEEFAKMVAVISRIFGLQHIELAEDIVSETFLLATETWERKGIPPNPTAWLYKVAKQKTLHHFRRKKILERKVIPELVLRGRNNHEILDEEFSPSKIRDSQLQMLFAVCNPAIAGEAQIGLALRILCGFGIDEITDAFLSNKETINKRLFRAKEKLRAEKVRMELPGKSDIADRLDNVLHIIYLMFNEGYYSKSSNQILRREFCLEAMRLCVMLTEFEITNTPQTNALMSLMCFHASRFDARQTGSESLVLYGDQDEQLWDMALIRQGMHFLGLSARGDKLSSYHLEARIACWHCIKEESSQKWEEILQLYDQLMRINYSPSVALNRTFALGKVKGPEVALTEAKSLGMNDNHYYFVLLGELYKGIDLQLARIHFQKAHDMARTDAEKQLILDKLNTLH